MSKAPAHEHYKMVKDHSTRTIIINVRHLKKDAAILIENRNLNPYDISFDRHVEAVTKFQINRFLTRGYKVVFRHNNKHHLLLVNRCDANFAWTESKNDQDMVQFILTIDGVKIGFVNEVGVKYFCFNFDEYIGTTYKPDEARRIVEKNYFKNPRNNGKATAKN